jgi:hypothetical protein
MLAVELDRTVQFPRLPLAKTVIRIGTEIEHNRKYEVEGRANLSRGENPYRKFSRMNAD